MQEGDRLRFAYATRGCVPSRDIPFVGHDWVDEEEEQRGQSCKLPEQSRHDTQWNMLLMTEQEGEKRRRGSLCGTCLESIRAGIAPSSEVTLR